MKTIVTFALVLVMQGMYTQNENLIPVKINDLWAYIDTLGRIKIKPQFKDAGIFSNNLAPVRKGGYYYYLSTSGEIKFNHKFDYAESFENGFAKVNEKGKFAIINEEGKTLFKAEANEMISSPYDNFIEVIKDSKHGLFNLKTTQWVLKPEYRNINLIGDQFLAVRKFDSIEYDEYAICNYRGEFITDFLKITSIADIKNTGLLISVDHGSSNEISLLNYKGKLISNYFLDNDEYIDDQVENDLIKVRTGMYNTKKVKYINPYGKTLIKNKHFTNGTYFLKGRALVEINEKNWAIINESGNIVSKERFNDIGSGFFTVLNKSVIAIAKNDKNKVGIINQNGDYLVAPKYQELDLLDEENGLFIASLKPEDNKTNKTGDEGNSIFYGSHNGTDNTSPSSLSPNVIEKKNSLEELLDAKDDEIVYGCIDLNNQIMIPFKYKELKPTPYAAIYYFIDETSEGLIKKNGSIIWQQALKSEPKNQLDTLNVSYMERAYCFASSNGIYLESLGGWGGSDNLAQSIRSFSKRIEHNKLQLWIDTLSLDTFNHQYAGRKMYLFNSTADTAVFNAQDSRLYITMQAQDSTGNWKDIEYTPHSWCGNSYHQVALLPLQYWTFSIPLYKGELPTKMRMKCISKEEWNQETKEYESKNVLYSNEFTSSVNPAQFWRKKGHQANNIMDSYDD